MCIVRNQFFDFGIGFVNVFGIARQSHPTEWTHAAAEQRTDVSRHETWEIKRVLHAHVLRHLANVVAIVKRRDAQFLEIQHRLHMHCHRGFSGLYGGVRIGFGGFAVLFPRHALWQIAV